jgi:hypothetical protein
MMSPHSLRRGLLAPALLFATGCGRSPEVTTAALSPEVTHLDPSAKPDQQPLSTQAAQSAGAELHTRQPVVRPPVDDKVLAAIVRRLRCIPRDNFEFPKSAKERLSLYDQATCDDFDQALAISDTQLAALSGSGDDRSISLAIFVAVRRGDSRALLRIARENLNSKRMAIPQAILDDMGVIRTSEQALGHQLSDAMVAWFGTDSGAAPELFDKLFPGYPEFAAAGTWVYPWLNRARRARKSENTQDWKSFVQDIQDLPEVNRAVVAALRFSDGLDTSVAECMELMGTLSEPSRADLLDGAAFLPDEPWFSNDADGWWRRYVRSSLRELLEQNRQARSGKGAR